MQIDNSKRRIMRLDFGVMGRDFCLLRAECQIAVRITSQGNVISTGIERFPDATFSAHLMCEHDLHPDCSLNYRRADEFAKMDSNV
jgi:hypothetical protein